MTRFYAFILFLLPAVLLAKDPQGSVSWREAPLDEPTATTKLAVSWQDYPLIADLHQTVGIFAQFLSEVKENKKRWAQGKSLLPIAIYLYQLKNSDSIFSISAKTSISVESIATLNRLQHSGTLPQSGSYILLPNNSGVFLPPATNAAHKRQIGLSSWERQLRRNRAQELFYVLVIARRSYSYYPRSRFNSRERRYFLDNTLRSPVQGEFYVTSNFGTRRDPISGKKTFHDGQDIRSPYGATVFSVANGTVLNWGESPLYGLFVRVQHSSGKYQEALYGHLSTVLVRRGQHLKAGEALGNSGDSGRSTGPHLHLSIFHNGRALDPAPLFRSWY